MREQIGFVPRRSTVETVLEHGRRRRARGLGDEVTPHRYEAELEEFLRSRGRRDERVAEPAMTSTSGRAPRR